MSTSSRFFFSFLLFLLWKLRVYSRNRWFFSEMLHQDKRSDFLLEFRNELQFYYPKLIDSIRFEEFWRILKHFEGFWSMNVGKSILETRCHYFYHLFHLFEWCACHLVKEKNLNTFNISSIARVTLIISWNHPGVAFCVQGTICETIFNKIPLSGWFRASFNYITDCKDFKNT